MHTVFKGPFYIYYQAEITCSKKQSSQLVSVLLIVVVFVLHQWTPLHVGAQKGRCEKILGYLLEHGANLDTKDNNGVRM